MIPAGITHAHVVAAMADIDREGVPRGRASRRWRVRHRGATYPPKLLVSIAHRIATGHELRRETFSGGTETNNFLRRLGFTIVPIKRSAAGPIRPTARRGPILIAANSPIEPAKIDDLARRLVFESTIRTWPDIQANRELPPKSPGVYAWFFASAPPEVPTNRCVMRDGRYLLYVGISPSSPQSRQTLRSRIRSHFRGNAQASTLRMTLGCLLGMRLFMIGASERLVSGQAERELSDWMAANAGVAWVVTDQAGGARAESTARVSFTPQP